MTNDSLIFAVIVLASLALILLLLLYMQDQQYARMCKKYHAAMQREFDRIAKQ